MTASPRELAEHATTRVSEQIQRINGYGIFYDAYYGRGADGRRTFGNYADGRPAMKDPVDMRLRLQGRPAPNTLKPVIDDVVSVAGLLPTITFDAEGASPEQTKQAVLVSRVVRGQYEQSQMDVGQANAVFFMKLLGDVCYTLDPLRPSEAKKSDDPFALPGVYINVHDPSHCYPRFGSGREFNRIQDLFLVYDNVPREQIDELYPDAARNLTSSEPCTIIMYYDKRTKCTVLRQGQGQAHEAFRDDHGFGFVPAEWAINKATGRHWGLSEIDQSVELQKVSGMLFNLAMDSAISSVFPIYHAHNAEHVGRLRIGPGSIIETVEDGKFEILQPLGDSNTAVMLHNLAQDNLLKQTGTSPIRVEGAINHSNISQRAQSGAQAPMEQRLAMSSTILGSTLQWLNSKIALMLYSDKEFTKAQMSVYGTDQRGQRFSTTFTGNDLGGLWRNHVKWPSLLGGNEHEQLVMSLQLEKEMLYSGRKVLETIGEDDPEHMLEEAAAWQQMKGHMMQQAQGGGPPPGGPGGGPPGGNPTQMADQGVALGAGAMPGGQAVPAGPGAPPDQGGGAPGASQPPPPAPPGGGGMPPFTALPSPPGAPGGSATPVPDVWGMIQQAISAQNPQILTYVVNGGTIPGPSGAVAGVFVEVSDQRYIPVLRQLLKPVAQMVGGPDATVKVTLAKG